MESKSFQMALVPTELGVPRCPHTTERKLLPFSNKTLPLQAMYVQPAEEPNTNGLPNESSSFTLEFVNGDGKPFFLQAGTVNVEFIDALDAACRGYADSIFKLCMCDSMPHDKASYVCRTANVLPSGEILFRFTIWERQVVSV